MAATARDPIVKPVASPGSTQSAATSSSARVTPMLSNARTPHWMRLGGASRAPDDLTEEEAAKLEAEGKAAQKRLGKGPLPQPVPDVKKLARKEEKKGIPKPETKGKRGDRGKGKAAPKAGGAATAVLKVGPGKVAQYLAAKGAPVLLKGVGVLQKLRQNEQTHDAAAEKLQQSEKAVVIPPSEGQSKSNTGQVNTVSDRPAPTADENKGKQKLQESLKENIPQSIEDVDNFKRDQKAQHMGADVMKVVQGDKNAVVSTFNTMETTPPPAPPEHTPEALPPEEAAPPTANMNLGQGAIAPLQKEHTDVSNYTKEADGKLKEEGVTQEQLDMVDSGDLAAANKEKKGMETTAKTEPLAVQKFAQQETDKVDKDLKQEEKKERDGLKAKRKAGLGATTQKQKGAKSSLEKKREEVANKINGIFKAAQDKVKKKLADLETQSMKRFDDGNAKATKEFEDNVNREIDAFKDDRYSGVFGWARKARDWLLGMDDLPEVKEIFDRNRAIFVEKINKLVEDISADNKRVIQECKDELANAKKEIKDYVDKLGPDLKDIGKKAAEEMNAKLEDLDRFVAKKEQELQDKLKDKQQAAIKAIDEKIEKMKEAMSGALAKLGKLLLWAAKKFFTWALEKFGFSLADIEDIINKGVAVLKAIFTKPIQFVKNLVKAAINGFDNFRKNFLKHLKDAVFEWLTGSLSGIQLPESWNLKGILSVALQMLGLTWENIRGKLVKLVGEPVVKGLETTFTLVKTLITEGPMAAWEQLKEMAGDVQTAFIDAVKEWVRNSIIYKAVETILGLFIPGAGIIRAIIGIYDTVVFFIQKAKDIIRMVGNFLSSIAEIAAGNIGSAADALENGLARALTLVIDFLARFLRLSGITKKIQDAIQKIRSKVDAALDKVVNWIVAQAKKLGRMAAQAGVPQDPKERLQLGLRAAAAAVRQLPGNRVGRAIITPVLTALKLRYGFSSLEPQVRNGRWWIQGQVNPSDSIETDKNDTAVESPSNKYTITRLLRHQNRPGILSKDDAATLRNSLTELCKLFNDQREDVQKKGVAQTHDPRDPDRLWDNRHGVLYAQYVEDQAAAVVELRKELTGSEALFGLERGASLVAEQVAQGTGISPTHIPKPPDPPERRLSPGEQRAAQKIELERRIKEIMSGRKDAAVTISVASAWISGTETREVLQVLNRILGSGEFPNLQIKVLALRQTLGHDHKRRKNVVLTKEGSVQLVRARIPYIVGEDVNYQNLRGGEESKQPITIFRGTEEAMVAYQLTPTSEGRARDIIIDLTTGALKGKLPGVL